MYFKVGVCFLVSIMFVPVLQQQDVFHPGSVIPAFGKVAAVDSDMELNADTKLKLCFDVAEKSGGSINRSFDSAARFINLHVECGADAKNVSVAIVVHGLSLIHI